MSGLTIDINNKIDFGKITEDVKQVINDELEAFGLLTVGEAKTLCPVDLGFLRNHISFDKYELYVEIIVRANYAAFVEFGTGIFAEAYVPSLPVEIQEYAMTFFVNGKGRLPARPFLFPAIANNTIELIDNLKRQLT